jgi:hypothetical protein
MNAVLTHENPINPLNHGLILRILVLYFFPVFPNFSYSQIT